MKKLHAVVLVLLLGIAPLFGISVNQAAAAGATTHTWTGNAGDNKLSTAGNWNTNEVPDTNDSLIFPKGRTATIQADLGSVQLGGILVGSSGSGAFHYTIDGVLHASMIAASAGGVVEVDAAVHLHPSLGVGTFTAEAGSSLSVNSMLILHNLDTLRVSGPGTVTLDTIDITGVVNTVEFKDSIIDGDDGAGSIIFSGLAGTQPETYIIDNADITVFNDSLRPTGQVLVKGNSSLTFQNDQTYTAEKITLEDGALIQVIKLNVGSQDPADPHYTTTLTGHVELQGTVIYTSNHTDLKLTGDISGSGTIVPEEGTAGNVIVEPAAGKTNTSQLATGITKPGQKTTTITDSISNQALSIFENNVVIVNGERGDTTVFKGGVLKGIGKVGALDVRSGGTVAPGQSPGCLTVGNTIFNASSSLEVELAGKTACSEYDQLKVTGTIALGSATLNVSRLNDYKPAAGDTFVIIDNDGNDAITGTFSDLAEGATFTVDGYVFKVTYTGGDGNDAAITVQNVPTTPNTGMQLLTANPLLTLALTAFSAGMLFVIAKRYSAVSKK